MKARECTDCTGCVHFISFHFQVLYCVQVFYVVMRNLGIADFCIVPIGADDYDDDHQQIV